MTDQIGSLCSDFQNQGKVCKEIYLPSYWKQHKWLAGGGVRWNHREKQAQPHRCKSHIVPSPTQESGSNINKVYFLCQGQLLLCCHYQPWASVLNYYSPEDWPAGSSPGSRMGCCEIRLAPGKRRKRRPSSSASPAPSFLPLSMFLKAQSQDDKPVHNTRSVGARALGWTWQINRFKCTLSPGPWNSGEEWAQRVHSEGNHGTWVPQLSISVTKFPGGNQHKGGFGIKLHGPSLFGSIADGLRWTHKGIKVGANSRRDSQGSHKAKSYKNQRLSDPYVYTETSTAPSLDHRGWCSVHDGYSRDPQLSGRLHHSLWRPGSIAEEGIERQHSHCCNHDHTAAVATCTHAHTCVGRELAGKKGVSRSWRVQERTIRVNTITMFCVHVWNVQKIKRRCRKDQRQDKPPRAYQQTPTPVIRVPHPVSIIFRQPIKS